jgi:LacI family transcriptional regulator
MSNSRVTVRKIAEIAGVSIATVSRVSRGVGQVSPELRAKVLAAIDEYGYRPSHMGRALAERRHGSLAVVCPGLSGPYFSELIQGFEAETLEYGSSMHILSTHHRPDADEDVLRMSARVDGIAVLGGTVRPQVMRALAETLPVVVLAGRPAKDIPAVRVDNATMRDLTRHLLTDHGYRRLVFVGEPVGSADVMERWEAFRQAHVDLDLPAGRSPVRVGMQQSDGVAAAAQVLDRPRRPDAVVCANDELALGVLISALGRGLAVPGDVAITGFDDMPMAALVRPALTTVRQSIRELGAATARSLFARLDGQDTTHDLVLGTELVFRGSCGCPSRDG